MIKIENLVKIYKSKKKGSHRALNKINLTLGNKGLVFVLGKSGSGKSTLLNLIGGLDTVTEGRIIVDGNDISKLKERKFCNYRNTHIGFVFQDYHLIEELSIYDNIVLSLNLQKIDDNNDVLNALKIVDLEGYEHRLPSELSGGERQRVAIARAIIKKPRIILADEPTGNLDPVTATAILDILKDLSKECLVLVVSHNENDAYKYADRIIKLSEGEIINDYVKNNKIRSDLVIENETIVVPHDRVVTDQEIDYLNKQLQKKKIRRIAKSERKYIPFEQENIKEEFVDIQTKNLSAKNTAKLSFKFLKSKIGTIVLSSFITAVIVIVFGLAASFMTFDGGQVIKSEMDDLGINRFSVSKIINDETKTSIDTNYNFYLPLSDEDYQKFEDSKYEGNIYPIYNYTFSIRNMANASGVKESIFISNTNLFIRETAGTMIVTEDYLKNVVGGDIEWVVKSEEEKPYGIYISDYVADSIIRYSNTMRGKTYDQLLGRFKYSNGPTYKGYINGIFKSGYKEKYADIFQRYLSGEFTSSKPISKQPEFITFSNEVYSFYGMCFTYNNNFFEDLADSKNDSFIYHNRISISESTNKHGFVTGSYAYLHRSSSLEENEIILSTSKYNALFGTNYDSLNLDEFVPHEATINFTTANDYDIEKPFLSKKVIIKSLDATLLYTGKVSHSLASLLIKNTYNQGILFEGNDHLDDLFKIFDEINLIQNLSAFEGVNTMMKVVDVFTPIFLIIAVALIVGIIFTLTTFAMKMIRVKMHDIGIMKALGAKNRTMIGIFGLQLAFVSLVTCVLSTVGYYFLVGFTNTVLIKSLGKISKATQVLELNFVYFNPYIVLACIVIVLGLTFISLIIPILAIRRIEPVKIIKAKE